MRNAIRYAFAFAIAPTLMLAPTAPSIASERSDPGTLIGIVVGPNKEPAAGATVYVQNGLNSIVTSRTANSEGAFAFRNLGTDQNYLFFVDFRGSRFALQKIRIRAHGNEPMFVMLGEPSAPG